MKETRSREVVVEYERVQVIRKHSKTRVLYCAGCAKEADFITMVEGAALFSVQIGALAEFVNANDCHRTSHSDGPVHVCLPSLLNTMKVRSRIKLIDSDSSGALQDDRS